MDQQQKMDAFFSKKADEPERKPEENREPKNKPLSTSKLHWEAPEYVTYEKDKKWYIIFVSATAAIVLYATISNNPIMAITFVLIGLVFYLFAHKKPRVMLFSITHNAIRAGNEEYQFKDLHSFWIFYEEHRQVLSIETESKIDPYVHFPLGPTDPVAIRNILLEHLPEKEHHDTLIDVIQRLLRL